VLNLSRLDYLDSSGIGDLVHAYMSVIKRGGESKVVGLNERVEEILKITQLHQCFRNFKTINPRCEVFRVGATKAPSILEFLNRPKISP